MSDPELEFDAWNPGLSSEIPADLLPRVTLYDAKNSDTNYPTAQEAAGFCGLKPQDMTAFKVSRLALHEVLIRVTADLYVPDGPNYEELGLNLRGMVDTILTKHVHPKMSELDAGFEALQAEIDGMLRARLEADIYGAKSISAAITKPSLIGKLLGQKAAAPKEEKPAELLALAQWRREISTVDDPFDLACLKGLHAIVGGIVGQRGRLMADTDVVVRLASILVCNSYGSRRIGELINPIIQDAAKLEEYRLLPYQTEPFVMNVKGASAAGKSTIRPLQRELASKLGVPWKDFALVSPDYWRKYMLDYDSLGDQFKYAAMLTGQELEIIDKKLDGYMAEKATRGEMPHMLIDRFRFDSFESSSPEKMGSRLLSRFGHTVFMFFIITPPTETVERAWKRGQTTGRYKAVDDLLFHNIEAYTGMPQLFLRWVNKDKQKVHFEFLDNDVPLGERPKTVAYGWNGEITVLDTECMRRLNSYKNVNVEATRPQDVYFEPSAEDVDLLRTFIDKIPSVAFVDPVSSTLLARIEDRKCVSEADGFLESIGLTDVAAGDCHPDDNDKSDQVKIDIAEQKKFTIGVWPEA